jgi:O-antigen ligase
LWWAVLAQTNTQRLRTVALAWLVAACASAVLGLLQYFDISRDWAPWVNQPGLGRAFGNLRQRNQFATLCSMGVCTLWWWAQRGAFAPPRAASGWWAGGVLASAAMLGAASAASGSRTGLVQLVLLAVLVAWWAYAPGRLRLWQSAMRLERWVLPAALLAYVAASVLLPGLAGGGVSVLDRLQEGNGGDGRCTGRVTLWRNMLYLIAQKPLWGWGWGELGYAHFITLYEAPWVGLRNCELLSNAHNLPLHLAVELGLPLSLLVCATVLLWIKRQRPWRELRPERQWAWAVLGVIGVHSLLEYPLWYGQFQIAALLALWLLYAFPAGAATEPEYALAVNAPKRWGWRPAIAAVAIAAACAVAFWSYRQVSQPYLAPEDRAPQFRQQSWTQLRQVWLFGDQVDFAELAVTPVTPQTAPRLLELAKDLLHFSPEPMVVQKLLQSAQMLGRDAELDFYAPRFAAAYPDAYAQWAKARPVSP